MTKTNMLHEIELRNARNWLQLKTHGLHLLSMRGAAVTYHEYCQLCDDDKEYQIRLAAWYELHTLCESLGIDPITSAHEDVNEIHGQCRQIDSLIWKYCKR